MADLPNPKSYEQLLADMLSTYAAKVGINDFNVGSAVTSFFETVALTTARASGDVFQILRDYSVDRATGDTLKRLAQENRVTPIAAKPATGYVTVSDSTKKIATKIYEGASPPNIGSTSIKVSDASEFNASGSLYLGRGTPNVEGPIVYSSVVQSGNYYVINLASPTTKFHNLGESVIMAQGGNRSIPINEIVLSPSAGTSPDVQFVVTSPAVILDGETEVQNVQVSAKEPGVSGNVPRGAIKSFASPPFSGATVTNPLPFTNGQDSESDDQLRIRIKRALASKGLGTATAVKSSVIGATPSDEQSTIVSCEMIQTSDGAVLYIDDGNGYEAKSSGVGLESIVDSALGGEQYFQLATGGRQAPLAKAFLQSTLAAPFDLVGGDTLAVTVGEQTYQHVFSDSDFRSPGGATAFEITASINADTTLGFEATTSGGGQYIIIRAKTEGNDTLKTASPTTSGRDAAALLGLPSNEIQTLRLYKNKIPLSKDGKTASVFTQAQALWSASIASGETLILSVDGTAPITYTVTDGDFIATGLYVVAAATNSLESWAAVLNSKLTGVTVSIVGQQLKITSNLGTSNRASVSIDPTSTLVTKGMFSSVIGLSAQGKASDFILSRNTAQFQLVEPLTSGDQLSAGTTQTEARIESDQIPGGAITLSADAHIWLLIDQPGTIISHGAAGNSILKVETPAANTIRYTSNISGAFTNVQVGDYAIVWTNEIDANDRLEGRVSAKTSSSIDLVITPDEYAAIVTTNGVVFIEGIAFLRSTYVPQKFRVQAGTKTLDQIVVELNAQSDSVDFSVLQEQYLVIRSKTKDTSGSLLVVTMDAQGKLLGFKANVSDTSKDSLIAYYNSQEQEAQMPLFVHSSFAAGTAADPIDSFISSAVSTLSLAGRDPNDMICILHPYGSAKDAQAYGEKVQQASISGTTIGLNDQRDIRRLRSGDRYFIASPLDFGSDDTAVVVVDNDAGSKSFEIPFYRRGITNSTLSVSASAFNAYDVDSGSTSNFSSAFGSGFDFSNFKALMQARKVIKASASKTAILYRSARWGRSGERTKIGYTYPSAANSDVGSVITVTDNVNIKINLKSGAAVSSSIDASTEWNVSVTPNTPSAGIDQVTYSWTGQGTNPALNLNGGEYVNITTQTELSEVNTGVFRISTQSGFTPTSTSFTVQRPTGVAVSETNKATIVGSAINFYQASSTKASDISAYVNSNLADYVSATLVNDGGTDGSGVISLSTAEESSFAYDAIALVDGINWIASSNLAGSPQFTFKNPLTLPTDVGYSFNAGEEVRLVPTTMDQARRLINVLAVSGLSTVGTATIVDRGNRLELATNTLGSEGSIQIIGGKANQYAVPVLDAAIRLDNVRALISVDKVAAEGVTADQWFRLEASELQRKEALLSSNTSVTVLGNSPTTGQSTIKLANRAYNQRYFGAPRHHVRTKGNTFRVEKHGSLVCLSWDGVGTSPFFSKAIDFNDASGGTINVNLISGTSEADYIILSGNANFKGVSIGDLVTISGLPVTANNGTFLATGISSDGKTLRVLNLDAENEFSKGSITLTSNLTAGDTVTVGTSSFVADTDFAIGTTAADTATTLASIIGTLPGISASASSNVISIKATYAQADVALSYSGSSSVTLSGASLVGDSFAQGSFTATTSVSEGDTVIVGSPFTVLNQGKFRVVRRFNDSIWFENANVVEEDVTLPVNSISLGFDSTTSFKVNAANASIYLNWNGVGTEPHLENAQVGDVVNFGSDFNAANQGEWMVIRSGAKLQQVAELVIPPGSQFATSGAGKYFTINTAGNVGQYYVWFNVNGSNSDPAPVGLTGVAVAILSGDNASQVAAKVASAINGGISGLNAVASSGVVTVTTSGAQETNAPANVNVPSPFSVTVTQAGRRTFLECVNPSAVNESAVFVSTTLVCHRPQIQFYEYEAAVPGDSLVVTGDILGTSNAATYTIAKIIDRDTAIVTGGMASVNNASMNGRETAIFVQEGTAYTGYKRVWLASAEPGAPSRNYLVFDTNAQYSKIAQAAGVEMTSLNKLNFNTVIRRGLDSYRYNTGLIAEANRIIYGDPRDPETYSGVGAAGAEIFVREPLVRRIQLALEIRLATGVPFAQIAEQVRTNVSSLIDSNDVGQSIAISSIIASVNSIPGVKATAISSPQYDDTHDIITIAPSEKARIIDPSLDISVSQIGQ
jgi:uncharacterized phage protein gp47/JayE